MKIKIDLKENTVICGDAEDWLEHIPDNSIDMVYIDPPFFSNKSYEIVWGNGFELRSYDDRWKGGIEQYINWMETKIKKLERIIKPNGSIFLHCDWHASHRLRYLLDEVFGEKRFINEIIWCYTQGRSSQNAFGNKHDTIFWYYKAKTSGDKNYTFNVKNIKIPHELISEKSSCSFTKTDKDGRKYKEIYGTGSKHKKYKYYKDEGKIPYDWWTDIPKITGRAAASEKNEKIGYKTQKPESLLKRIIECSTNEGDIVLDCFGGGGTTAKVAADLNRKFIIGDVSPVAVRVIAYRLNEAKHVYSVKGTPHTKEEWLKLDGKEFEKIFCDSMGYQHSGTKGPDGGVDGWANKKSIPVQIKNHKKRQGAADIKKFLGTMHTLDKKIGIFVAWSFASSAHELSAKLKKRKIDLRLIEVGEVLKPLILNDDQRKEQNILYTDRVMNKKQLDKAK